MLNTTIPGSTIGSAKSSYIKLLPLELLALIFRTFLTIHDRNPTVLLLTAQEVDTPSDSDNNIDTAPLVTLSHVCQYWRNIALGTPEFWRRIDGRCHNQTNVFLEQSQPMTVHLLLSVGDRADDSLTPPPPSPHMAFMINTHAGRLHRLDLFLSPCQYDVIPLLAPLQAPHLQVLTLLSSSMFPFSMARHINRESLLNGGASSLRELAIIPVIDWMPAGTPFPHLTHLVLYFCQIGICYHPYDILELLSNAPVLAFLHLGWLQADGPYSGSWHPRLGPVPLRHLRTLVFTSSTSRLIHDVLPHLSLPETILIRLQGIYDFGSNLPTHLPTVSLRPVTSLDLSIQDDHVLMVADGQESGLWIGGHLRERQRTAPAGASEAWLALLRESLGTKALANITHLHIFIHHTHTFWTDILAQLPLVSHLKVFLGEPPSEPTDAHDHAQAPPAGARSSTAVLCEALCPPSLDSTALVPIPALCELTITWEEEEDFASETAAAFPQFPSMLVARARAGHPVRRVVVQAPLSCTPARDAELGSRRERSLADALLRSCGDLLGSELGPETEYEVVHMGDFVNLNSDDHHRDDDDDSDGGKLVGSDLCMFVMRAVWRVEGEDKYWKQNFDDRPHYDVRPWT